ncbi:pyridoxal phosphate-dependent transferase [Peziza echinospora]|nr:pyridoxal phosphate-dependent transferase [Peziza echinospora]
MSTPSPPYFMHPQMRAESEVTVVPPSGFYDISMQDAINCGYNPNVERIREEEYPFLTDTTYMDHSGATLYPTSLVDRSATILKTQLLGNPHSGSPSSALATQYVNQVRKQALRFFNANESEWDVVFVANATAGIKLIADGFSGASDGKGFNYRYHQESHTSLIGVRELSKNYQCLDDKGVGYWLSNENTTITSKASTWINSISKTFSQCLPIKTSGNSTIQPPNPANRSANPSLFAYPAQSNLTGRRLPLNWAHQAREKGYFTLLDAAALLMTKPLDLSNTAECPDYIVFSWYKIFGLPDLGGVLVKRGPAASILHKRKFFGGGTIDALTAHESYSSTKTFARGYNPHEGLEDGSLPFHSIVMLGVGISRHAELYGNHRNVGRHTAALAWALHGKLSALRHSNGAVVVEFYSSMEYLDTSLQGPVICFNILTPQGTHIGYLSVEQEAARAGIHIRVGGNCNPGGIEKVLGFERGEMLGLFGRGKKRCGDEVDLLEDGSPIGVVRASLGAVSTWEDVLVLVEFVRRWVDFGVRQGQYEEEGKRCTCGAEEGRRNMI